MELNIKKSLLISLCAHLSLFLVLVIASLFNPLRIDDQRNMVSIETEVSGLDSASPAEAEVVKKVPEKKKPVVTAPKRVKNTQKLIASMKTAKTVDKNRKSDDDDGLAERKAMALKLSNEQAAKINRELDQVAGDVDKALNENTEGSGNENASPKRGTGGNDPLGDAGWSLKPRKTVYFPNIQSKIPDKYKKKGMSYSLTARIAFDRNGIAARVDIASSSGDPNIDNIFFSELKKVRVEPINENRTDVITKRFSISLK